MAMGETLTGHIASENNYTDLLFKVLYGQKQRRLVDDIILDIYD